MEQSVIIREIQKGDQESLAKIIRSSLEEFGAAKQGTVYYDSTTDNLSELFRQERSSYFVAQVSGWVAGGAGIFPTQGLEEDTCELVKMYVSSRARKKGIGQLLLQTCMKDARQKGFRKMYIETMPELTLAIQMYLKAGFNYIEGPLGSSGHTGCSIFMLKTL